MEEMFSFCTGAVKRLRLDMVGVTPLCMHSTRTLDPFDELSREIRALSSKRNKTDTETMNLIHLGYIAAMYWDKEIGPYIPGIAVEACIRNGAKFNKLGSTVERFVEVEEEKIPLIYEGPRDPEKLWQDKRFRDVRAHRVQMNRVVKAVPKFPVWSASCTVSFVDSGIDTDRLVRAIHQAAMWHGLLALRPKFGKFQVECTELPDK